MKTNKAWVVLILASLMLTACVDYTVTNATIKDAQGKCPTGEEMKSFISERNHATDVTKVTVNCSDGSQVTFIRYNTWREVKK